MTNTVFRSLPLDERLRRTISEGHFVTSAPGVLGRSDYYRLTGYFVEIKLEGHSVIAVTAFVEGIQLAQMALATSRNL